MRPPVFGSQRICSVSTSFATSPIISAKITVDRPYRFDSFHAWDIEFRRNMRSAEKRVLVQWHCHGRPYLHNNQKRRDGKENLRFCSKKPWMIGKTQWCREGGRGCRFRNGERRWRFQTNRSEVLTLEEISYEGYHRKRKAAQDAEL